MWEHLLSANRARQGDWEEGACKRRRALTLALSGAHGRNVRNRGVLTKVQSKGG